MNPSIESCPKILVSKITVSRSGDWLIASFPELYASLSWAVLGGQKEAKNVAWLRVKEKDLLPGVDSVQYLKQRLMSEMGLDALDVVGLLTSANLDEYVDIQKNHGEYEARSIATVGLTNALRIGDVPTASHDVGIGTINLLCVVSHPLSYEAQLEAISLAAEARTAAVLEAHVSSPLNILPATGTGTDCIVIASPRISGGIEGVKYAGKHTMLGSLVGSSTYEAIRLGIERWKSRQF